MNDKPDHKRGRECQHEINKCVDDYGKGRITRDQMSRDVKELKKEITQKVVNPLKGRPKDS